MLFNETITIMKLPKELTTINLISKILAGILFFLLPLVGFFIGIRYQEMMNLAKRQETADWKTYTNSEVGFSILYPPNLLIVKDEKNELNLASLSNDEFLYYYQPNTGSRTKIKYNGLYKTGYYAIDVSVKNNYIYEPPDSMHQESVIENFLTHLFGTVNKKPIEKIQGRKTVGTYSTSAIGERNLRDGVYEYTIYDGLRVIELRAYSSNLNKISLEYLNQILSTFRFTNQTSTEGQFCGGIAGIPCSQGYECKLDEGYSDARSKCVKL